MDVGLLPARARLKDHLRKDWRKLKDGKPGSRFEDFYQFRLQHRRGGPFSPVRILTIAVGLVLMFGGMAIGWLPGPGGFVAIIGLALLAQEFRPIASLLDRIEPRLHQAWRWLKKRFSR
jgi:hypothetical protein